MALQHTAKEMNGKRLASGNLLADKLFNCGKLVNRAVGSLCGAMPDSKVQLAVVRHV